MTELLDRARKSLATARYALDTGDLASASSRAYYAIFDAARAVLGTAIEIDVYAIRRHPTFWNVFSSEVVLKGLFPRELASAARTAENMRLAADYRGGEITVEDVRAVLVEAGMFVAECDRILQRRSMS